MCCVQSERVFPASDSDEEVCRHELPLESQWAEACSQGHLAGHLGHLGHHQRQQLQHRQSRQQRHGQVRAQRNNTRRSFSSSVVADLRAVEQDCILVSAVA